MIDMPSGIEAEVCADIASRQARGIVKYGTTVADNPLSLKEWLEHAYQETLDTAVYLKRAIREIENTTVTMGDSSDNVCGWKIYKVNRCDWFMAETIGDAESSALRYYNGDDEMIEAIRQLDAHDLNRLMFSLTDDKNGPKITFREELRRRVQERWTKAEMFASTEQ